MRDFTYTLLRASNRCLGKNLAGLVAVFGDGRVKAREGLRMQA